MKKITSVVGMRDELLEVFAKVEGGKIDLPIAQELSNIAGKVLGTVKVELAQAALCGYKPNIKFLGDNKKCLPA